MTGTVHRLLIAGLLVAALAGCTDPGQGQDPPARTLPPRPATVAADRIAPCSMFTPEQQRELGFRRQTPKVANVNGVSSPACGWLSTTAFDVNIQYIPLGAELALSEPGAVVVDVNGFGAVQSVPDEQSDGTPFCQVAVDTGPGQSIRVQALTSADKNVPASETCRQANHVASLAMTTILAATRS